MNCVEVTDVDEFLDNIESSLSSRKIDLEVIDRALSAYPHDSYLLTVAGFASLLADKPKKSLALLKRFRKKFIDDGSFYIWEGIALAMDGQIDRAVWLFEKHKISLYRKPKVMQHVPSGIPDSWLSFWVNKIVMHGDRLGERLAFDLREAERRVSYKNQVSNKNKLTTSEKNNPLKISPQNPTKIKDDFASEQITVSSINTPLLTKLAPKLNIHIQPIEKNGEDWANYPVGSPKDFELRLEISKLSLAKDFNELLCLSQLTEVTAYWYQIETVRKVLKNFHGRVLLADEVGLGKTIEAGMILKEYTLRGMVNKVLILTPASLVAQWRDELTSKFALNFVTTLDAAFKKDPVAFWTSPYIIASIGTAKRVEHFQTIMDNKYDLLIVDEAHHLKNRSPKNWELVDKIQKRFLVLLSATPVQNNLIELYNLLTLLKPGIFKTEKEFRLKYCSKKNPRLPANPEQLRFLMRDAMIRNTRALANINLPGRQAKTIRVEATELERTCYESLTMHISKLMQTEDNKQRLTYQHLLASAGSLPQTTVKALERYLLKHQSDELESLLATYKALALTTTSKQDFLLKLLRENVEEKKIIFVRFSETLLALKELCDKNHLKSVVFHGQLTANEKEEAILSFRSDIPILISTESGGEGRNLQFCNTLINFDLPWNPQAIEQRIGRIHRIGQEREVFIFNLTTKDTLEERMLSILDEKLNMFELVAGEMQTILGNIDEDVDFASMIFSAWVAATSKDRESDLLKLEEKLLEAKKGYVATKELDEKLFAEELGVL